MRTRIWLGLSLGSALFALVACSGSDGAEIGGAQDGGDAQSIPPGKDGQGTDATVDAPVGDARLDHEASAPGDASPDSGLVDAGLDATFLDSPADGGVDAPTDVTIDGSILDGARDVANDTGSADVSAPDASADARTPTDAATNEPDAVATADASDAAVTSDAALGVDAGACGPASNGNACNAQSDLGNVVSWTCGGDGPVADGTGGTLVDGTYVVTSATLYEPLACGGQLPTSFSQTLVVTGGCMQLVRTVSGHATEHLSAAAVVNGAAMDIYQSCPAQQHDAYTFTATPTTLTLVRKNKEVIVLTKK
jgi:hypothetical protein